MSGTTDQVKRAHQRSGGALTDDDRLKREGKRDQAVGKMKVVAEKAVEQVQDA